MDPQAGADIPSPHAGEAQTHIVTFALEKSFWSPSLLLAVTSRCCRRRCRVLLWLVSNCLHGYSHYGARGLGATVATLYCLRHGPLREGRGRSPAPSVAPRWAGRGRRYRGDRGKSHNDGYGFRLSSDVISPSSKQRSVWPF